MKDVPKQLILFDGLCIFCDNSINYIIKKDRKDQFKFAALQSAIGQFLVKDLPQSTDSIIYVRNDKVLIKSTAVLYIAKDLGYPFKLLFIFKLLPTSWRDCMYSYIAKNRYRWFGKKEHCEIPTDKTRQKFIS